MQITPEQFEVACLEGRQSGGPSNAFSFHQGLFQQVKSINLPFCFASFLNSDGFKIWAANDIRIFIRMMTQRNVELQLQALDLIERRHNSTQKDDQDAATSTFEETVTQVDIALVYQHKKKLSVKRYR